MFLSRVSIVVGHYVLYDCTDRAGRRFPAEPLRVPIRHLRAVTSAPQLRNYTYAYLPSFIF